MADSGRAGLRLCNYSGAAALVLRTIQSAGQLPLKEQKQYGKEAQRRRIAWQTEKGWSAAPSMMSLPNTDTATSLTSGMPDTGSGGCSACRRRGGGRRGWSGQGQQA